MSEQLAVAVMVMVGVQFSCQAPINGRLARLTGSIPAATISFLTGTVVLSLLVVASGEAGRLGGVADTPPQYLTGGLLGAMFILAGTATVGSIGAGAVAASTVTGQLGASLVLDQAGWLGLDRVEITPARLAGAALLLAGTVLIVWRRGEGRLHALPVAAMLVAGCAVAVQPPINAVLADHTGDLASALVSFAIGSVVLAAAALLTGRASGFGGLRRARPWLLLGGVIGVVNVTSALILVRTIGAAGLAAATIAGLLLGSIALDRIGFMGLERRPLTPARLTGIVLLCAGTALVLV